MTIYTTFFFKYIFLEDKHYDFIFFRNGKQ